MATKAVEDAVLEIHWDNGYPGTPVGWFYCPQCGSWDTLFTPARDVEGNAHPDLFRCWHCDWEAAG